MTVCRYGRVEGVVQGVGFRAFVEREARAAGLSGFARNLRDGGVEVLLCGDEASVAAVQEKVAQGPRAARVDGITWEDRPNSDIEGFFTG